jgi:RNA polymerase sigma factor (sigma-70 family)
MRIFKKDSTKLLQQSQTPEKAPEDITDEALIRAIAEGAVWAMELLYQRYNRLLYSLAYRMVTDHQVAEDLLQESFLAVWRRATTYSAQSGEVRSWLFSIVHHRTIDYLRALQRSAVLNKVPLDDVLSDESVVSPDTWDEAWLSVQRSNVREALMSLPKEQRLVIELAYFQGWTHSEIAEGCRLPLGTVKARMRLGLLHLKRTLERKGVTEI